MAEKHKFSDKLRHEREGTDSVPHGAREPTAKSAGESTDSKKSAQRRQVRREAASAKARKGKLRQKADGIPTAEEKQNAGFAANAQSGRTGGKAAGATATKCGGKAISKASGRAASTTTTTTVVAGGVAGVSKPKKHGNLAVNMISAKGHQAVNSADEDGNAGVESANFAEGSAESAVRIGSHAHYSHKLRQYLRAENEAVDRLYRESLREDPQTGSNPFSRFKQRQEIKKQYAAAKVGKSGAAAASGASNTASGAKEAAKETKSITEKAFAFVKEHSHVLLIIAAVALLMLVISGMFSSCSAMLSGGGNVVIGTSYTAEDEDLKNADADYTALESALRTRIDRIERDYPDYDEYNYNLVEIGHNPYELASLLTVEFEVYTREEVQERLQSIFDAQYELKIEEEVEIRTRTVESSYTDPDTGETIDDSYEEEYEYYILNVTLINRGVDYVAQHSNLSGDQLERYGVLQETRGNRDDLFADVAFSATTGEYTDYDIPGEALTDEKFRRMITEAEKYLGYPYVWGGSSPSTSFDCSGFVSWVINHCGNGWNVGRQTANGLMSYCDIIPKSQAKPGDLIFFQGTYNTSGASHVGIYVGGNMMIHCGNPISYASIDTSYWQQHYYCMGRIR